MVNMAQQLISEIAAIHRKLATKMTEAQKADWQGLAEKRLDALDAFYNPVDTWGRSEAQQKEDAENPCLCIHPLTSHYSHQTCCTTCGFFCAVEDSGSSSSGGCGSCGNFGKCSIWCEDNEEYWESHTWQTCRDCGVYVCGLYDHQAKCEDFLYNKSHCEECGNLVPEAVGAASEVRCRCAYDQDNINTIDLPYNRRLQTL